MRTGSTPNNLPGGNDHQYLIRRLGLVCLAGLLTVGLQPLSGQAADTTEILLGPVSRGRLAAEVWPVQFRTEYSGYDVSDSLLGDLREVMDGAEVAIYFGTWCKDSRRQMPRFFRLMDTLGIVPELVSTFGLNKAKQAPPVDGREVNIHHTPTFIISRAGAELGRIIETPVESLEADLLKILSGQSYTPHHAGLEQR